MTGGLLHKMWKLNTNKGSYAIKQLSKDIQLTTMVKKSYELTEIIADQFKQFGIPAISALQINNHHLIDINGTAYLAYPWVDAKALDKDTVSEKHALKIAAVIAKMHLIDLKLPELDSPEFDSHSNAKILQLINHAITQQCTFASMLKKAQAQILAINDAYQTALPLMKERIVISHGDLDQKNVLWDQHDNPILIDWESARKLNPTYEIVNAALDWSGITSDNFNSALVIKMITAYQATGGIINHSHLHAAFYGVLGNWLNWMVYNIVRACKADDLEQQAIGTEQVQQVVPTLLRLESLISVLVAKIRDTG